MWGFIKITTINKLMKTHRKKLYYTVTKYIITRTLYSTDTVDCFILYLEPLLCHCRLLRLTELFSNLKLLNYQRQICAMRVSCAGFALFTIFSHNIEVLLMTPFSLWRIDNKNNGQTRHTPLPTKHHTLARSFVYVSSLEMENNHSVSNS